ncbi:MAG: disulfide bond formation protein B [Gammaproteobacteria bacterium]|jgi:disulfide bond formation protein DsbB|nr:disulfide bond formation protein B [Gammaproteobacteria bacterium]
MKLTIRPLFAYLFIFSLCLLSGSFILQFHYHLEPCPLCIIDRIIVFFLTIFFVIALFHNPKGRINHIYCITGFLLSLMGMLSTTRHLWIMHLPPDQVPECGPGLEYLFGTLPPTEAFLAVIRGSGECATKNSELFGLSLPAWTLIAFIVLAIGCLLPLWAKKRDPL